jgi:hypothetical protein
MQSLRTSATPLDPPSEWVTQRAPPLPKLTQSASADNPLLPVFADERHAKNSATVTPTKMTRRTIKAISLADRLRKSISTADSRELALAPRMFPNMTSSGTRQSFPILLVAQGAVKTQYRMEPQGIRGM